MPCIESLAIWCFDREWRHLAFRKAKWFSIMDVLPEKGIDLMGIKSTMDCISTIDIETQQAGNITIVAGEVSTAHQ